MCVWALYAIVEGVKRGRRCEAEPSLKWSGTAELVRLWNGMEGEGVYSFFSRVVVGCAKGRGEGVGMAVRKNCGISP